MEEEVKRVNDMIRHAIRTTSTMIPLILFVLLYSAGMTGAEPTTENVLEKVIKNYKDFSQGLSVPYQREIITKSMAMLGDDIKGDAATGIFYFKEPNRLKVHQKAPTEEYVISNGKIIWWYIPEKKIVHQYAGEHMEQELNALCKIFMGLKNPHEDFNISMTRSEDGSEFLLTLVPKKPLEEIDHLGVSVSTNDFRITMIEIHNIMGSITRFYLGKFKSRTDLNKGFFNFIPPEGVELISE